MAGLDAVGQGVGFRCHDKGGVAVANPRVFIRGEHARKVGQDLNIVGIKLHGFSKFKNGFIVTAQSEQQFAIK